MTEVEVKEVEQYIESVFAYEQELKDIRESMKDYKKSAKEKGLNITAINNIIKIIKAEKKLEEDADALTMLNEVSKNNKLKMLIENNM